MQPVCKHSRRFSRPLFDRLAQDQVGLMEQLGAQLVLIKHQAGRIGARPILPASWKSRPLAAPAASDSSSLANDIADRLASSSASLTSTASGSTICDAPLANAPTIARRCSRAVKESTSESIRRKAVQASG
jgi:hypothetical protein